MKVITAQTMQQVDKAAIEGAGIAGLTLMENAGCGCATAITSIWGPERGRVVIFAGKGNNGGDGYVIARHLFDHGWDVTVIILAGRDEITGDARVNLDRLNDEILVFCPEQGMLAQYASHCQRATVLVDALFGTGLKSDVSERFAEAVSMINNAGRPVVAVDIPSGINGTSGYVMGTAVKADLTVTFAFAKLGHVLYPGAAYCGDLQVVDIGIPTDIMADADGFEFLDATTVAGKLRPRERTAHKGSYGHSLIIAGSTGKTGAAAMAANSAVRGGSGLVTLAVPDSLNIILEAKTTEAMTLPVEDMGRGFFGTDAQESLAAAAAGKDVVAIGPGISRHAETAELIRSLVPKISSPVLIDADGLNAVSEDPYVLLRRQSSSIILTPHPGEMARLTGLKTAAVEADRIGTARAFAEKYGVNLVLKGARTVIASPDGRIAINGSGNPGMASGGMGDVLTGVLTALLAQGYNPFDACCIGTYVHGLAADLVAAEKGEIGLSAVDVQERLPYAFNELLKSGISSRGGTKSTPFMTTQ